VELKIVSDDELTKRIDHQIRNVFHIAFEENQLLELGKSYQANIHHGMQHTKDLIALSKQLIFKLKKEEEIDWKVLTISIILHDLFAEQDIYNKTTITHGKKSVDFFNTNFKSYFSVEQCKKVEEAISTHDEKSTEYLNYRESLCLESKILYDVDNLDAFGVKGFYRYVAIYQLKGIPFDHILGNVENRFRLLNFNESKEIGRVEYERITCLCKNYNSSRDREVSFIISFIALYPSISPSKIAIEALLLPAYLPGSWDNRGTFHKYFEELYQIYSKKN